MAKSTASNTTKYVSRTVRIGHNVHVYPGTTRHAIQGLHRVARASGIEDTGGQS